MGKNTTARTEQYRTLEEQNKRTKEQKNRCRTTEQEHIIKIIKIIRYKERAHQSNDSCNW